MRPLLYLVLAVGLGVGIWQLSTFRERRASAYADRIIALHNAQHYDAAILMADSMHRLHRDRAQLQRAAEWKERSQERLYEQEIVRLEAEQADTANDSIAQQLLDYRQRLQAIDRQRCERAARCQCVTAMKNARNR